MSSKSYIYSTLACDQLYTNYSRPTGTDLPIVAGDPVLIRGGAGVANDRLVTPHGVVTEVTEEQLAYLLENPEFLAHQQRGFIKQETRKIDEEAAASDMNAGDDSRQLTDAEMQAEGSEVTASTASTTTGKTKRSK